MEMEGYVPTARQPKHCGSTPCLLCGWRWKGTYQLPGNHNTVAARHVYCVGGDGRVYIPTNCQATKTLWQHALATMWVEGYLPGNHALATTRQPEHWCDALTTMWVEEYLPTARQPRLGHNQATRTLVSRLDHCVGGGVPANSQATKTLAARIDHCVDGDGGVLTNSQATKTLWQHALATVWVEWYLPTVSQPQHCGSTP